ncbi:MAG: hypothetical protein KIS90_03965 [Phenylobacterium sp.]|nr:hypothetical protein [Phenylobacterium sp.]
MLVLLVAMIVAALAGLASVVVGVFLIAGVGWGLIAGGLAALSVAGFLAVVARNG